MKVLVSSVEGNTQLLDGGAMFGNAPRAVWSKWTPPDEQGRIKLACRSLLVEIDGVRILCETGIGNFFDEKMRKRFGVQESENRLLANLISLGISEQDIDFVILSHLHFDHAGGLLNSYLDAQREGKRLLFPNAQYVVGELALHRCQKPHARDRASYIDGMADLLEASGRLIIVPEAALKHSPLPGSIEFRYSDGHTPGQMLTVIKGDIDTMVFLGDLVPGHHWVHLPITMGYDRFPELLIDEKKQLYHDMKDESWLGFYTHDEKFAVSRISQDFKGRFIPQDLKECFVRKAI